MFIEFFLKATDCRLSHSLVNCFFLCCLNLVICLATRRESTEGGQGEGCSRSKSFKKDIDSENLPQCFESTYFLFVNMCV